MLLDQPSTSRSRDTELYLAWSAPILPQITEYSGETRYAKIEVSQVSQSWHQELMAQTDTNYL